MMVHAFKPSTPEGRLRQTDLWVHGQPGLHVKIQTNQSLHSETPLQAWGWDIERGEEREQTLNEIIFNRLAISS